MKKRGFTLLFILFVFNLAAQLPHVQGGSIVRHASFESRFVTARHIDVWLPEGYSAKRKYDVLYMHDGQMLFDSAVTWNRQEWQVDEWMTRLRASKQIRNCIVVAIWNGGATRHVDYFPQKPFEALTPAQQQQVYAAARSNGASVFNDLTLRSDAYLAFIVTELKPFIDRTYATRKDRQHTFIAGSSMGGLISLYAICEYPEVFGGAACLSTHWPGIFTLENNPIPGAFFSYMQQRLPDPKTHRIYFDYGDQTLDAMYPPLQQQADQAMRSKGFSDKNWSTRYFPGHNHSEQAWSSRLDQPLLFLLKK